MKLITSATVRIAESVNGGTGEPENSLCRRIPGSPIHLINECMGYLPVEFVAGRHAFRSAAFQAAAANNARASEMSDAPAARTRCAQDGRAPFRFRLCRAALYRKLAVWKRFGLLLAFLTVLPFTAQAHKPSDSYLNLQIKGDQVVGQWDLAIRDLDFALGLDSNDDGAVTWGEIKEHQQDLTRYLGERLRLRIDDHSAPLALTEMLIDRHSDGPYVILRFTSPFSTSPARLAVEYSAFFDLDSQHRGLLRLESAGGIRTAIFSPEQSLQTFDLKRTDGWRQGLAFVRQGVWHIWMGLDHILFLIALLLPAVLLRGPETWRVAENFSAAFGNVLKIVTSFTVAHSLTLGLATFGVVRLPSRFVESMIAISVILAALHNFFPILKGRGWVAAFGFGLIHGFGFANVLAELGLSEGTLLFALLGFNVGVEAGQLAIVSAFLPVAYWLRGSWLYQGGALKFGSALIVMIASVWMFERLFDLPVLRF